MSFIKVYKKDWSKIVDKGTYPTEESFYIGYDNSGIFGYDDTTLLQMDENGNIKKVEGGSSGTSGVDGNFYGSSGTSGINGTDGTSGVDGGTNMPLISTEDELSGRMQLAVVTQLPQNPDSNTIYFIK